MKRIIYDSEIPQIEHKTGILLCSVRGNRTGVYSLRER